MLLRTDRSGFALPMVILVIGLMTAGVMAGFTRTTSEVQLLDNQGLQTTAFAVAEAGLERFIASGDTLGGVTYPYGDDNAVLDVYKMMQIADTTIYLIRSSGVVNAGAGRPAGRRTVAQLAYRVKGQMQVLSSWTSLSGLRKNGASGAMTGADACSGDVLPGVALPDGTFDGQEAAISGDPPIAEMGTQAEMAAQIDIDWVGISDPEDPAMSAPFVDCYSGTHAYDSRWDCTSWPSPAVFANSWPTVIINGSASLPGPGRGTLIVTGNLTLSGGDIWDGIVLVGGKITDNGEGAIGGAVVTGLNVLKGMPVEESSRANGTKQYTFDSCKVASAADGQSRMIGIQNAWVDNWTAW